MPKPFEITVHGDNRNRLDALRRTAIAILQRDVKEGRLAPLVAVAIREKPEEIDSFLLGMEIGMAYGFSLLLSGKVSLKMTEIDPG